jgi:hypothetical protein
MAVKTILRTENRYFMKNNKLRAGMLIVLFLMLFILPVAAQDATLARITLPVRGQTLRGSITIQGSATSPQFNRFQVAYALEPDTANWTIINGATNPVANGTLAVWNTRPVADGQYALQLQVVNTDGTVLETLVRDITLSNTVATSTASAESGTAITASLATTDTAIGLLSVTGANTKALAVSDLTKAFTKGATYALYGFGALAAYLILKKLLSLLFRRITRKPIDYGR